MPGVVLRVWRWQTVLQPDAAPEGLEMVVTHGTRATAGEPLPTRNALGSELPDFQLIAFLRRLRGFGQKPFSNFSVKVPFAALVTNARRNFLENDRRGAFFQNDGCQAWAGCASFAA